MSSQGIVSVKGDNMEVEKFYKALVQWQGRHPHEPLNVRNGNYVVYVQVVPPVKNAAPPTETAAPAPVPLVAVPLTCEACGQELPSDNPRGVPPVCHLCRSLGPGSRQKG